MYTPAHAWCSQHLFEMHTTLSAKNAYALVHARICNGAEASLPWKLLRTYLESCASIVQTVVCRPLLLPLLLSRPNLSPDAVRSRNPSKSTLAHDAVAAAVSHTHHSIIRVSVGLIQIVYGSHSRLATGVTSSGNLFSPFSREFSVFGEMVSSRTESAEWIVPWSTGSQMSAIASDVIAKAIYKRSMLVPGYAHGYAMIITFFFPLLGICLVRENEMSLLTGGILFVGTISKSAPPRKNSSSLLLLFQVSAVPSESFLINRF